MKIDQITFGAGKVPGADPLNFHPNRITIFIGPNNGGKSKALAELQHSISPVTGYTNKVISHAKRSKIEEKELDAKISRFSRPKRLGDDPSPSSIVIEGHGQRTLLDYSYLRNNINSLDDISKLQYTSNLLRLFYLSLGGGNRLSLADPVQAEPVGSPANTTIARIFGNDSLREKISSIVYKGFKQYLVIDPTQLPLIGYRLSDTRPENDVEKHLTNRAAEYFREAMPLAEASDGTRAFVGLLAEVLAGDPDIIFVDEPEAFLHPALQFLLGQQIAANVTVDKQVFAATHSPSFLLGCVLAGVDVDVIRLTYKSKVSSARLLKSDRLKSLMTDPLFRSVNAASALFYDSAIVVEGDSDRAFYDEINVRMARFSSLGLQHATFLNAHNKQTVVNIVRPLRDIGVPAAFILDIDWIKEDGQVWERYFGALGAPAAMKDSFSALRRSIRNMLESADLDYKRRGGIQLLDGEDRAAAEAFFDSMEQYGLFTVRSGELESWLPQLDVERSKNKWLASVFSAMGSDPDDENYLKPNRDDVWHFMERIAGWVSDPNRRGMGS